MRVIPTRIHAVVDYLVGGLLMVSPWLFDFYAGGIESGIPAVLGFAVIVYSLCTDYELGVIRGLSMPIHLWLDGLGGALLAASPWLFGFSEIVWLPHLVVGLLEIGMALTTQTRPAFGAPLADHRPV